MFFYINLINVTIHYLYLIINLYTFSEMFNNKNHLR